MAELPIESRGEPRQAARWRRFLALGIIALTFIAFAESLKMDFVFWDDDVNVYENPHIRGLTAENLRWMFQDVDQALRYKPLSWLTWAAIFEVNGLAPFGYHLANVIFHALNAGLVFFVLSALLRADGDAAQSSEKRTLIASALGALVWALHPLRVEPVAWVTGLPYGQALFFMLLSLLCYLHSAQSLDPGPRRKTFYVLALVTFGLALLTYPIVIGYVIVLLALDFYPLRRFGHFKWSDPSVRRVLVEKIPFVAAGVAFVAVNLYGRLHTTENWASAAAPTLDQFGLMERLAQAFYVWANYLWRQWWPFDLSPFYVRLVEFTPTQPVFIASAAIVLGVTAFAYYQRRARPALLAVWVSYLALLVPVLGLTDHPHFAADRYGIIAALCWSVLISAALVRVEGLRIQLLCIGAAVGLVFGLQWLTLRQIPIWQDTVTFCRYTLKTIEEPLYRGSLHKRLAIFFIKASEYAQAEREISHFVALDPQQAASTYSLLGRTLANDDKPDEAMRAYERSVSLNPANLGVRCELALLLATNSRIAEAEHHYGELLRLSKATVPAKVRVVLLDALASGHAAKGQMEKACARAAEAVQLAQADPKSTNFVQLSQRLERYRQARAE